MERIGWRAAPQELWRELPGIVPGFWVAATLAAVLVPLPQALVDLLLSASLAFSVLVFVAALRTREALAFASFPSLLLLATSFRLVLNTATTRLILAEGDAGRVIDAFAGFVTRGDLIVGVVMFGIITAIQYLVIARGSERVAEVGARFALDGMPGRQAAIEADLRSGSISPSEAARRRAELDARSDFHGSMDGAVKFVKADAIVGLLIVGINLVGGAAMGVLREDMELSAALAFYGRLAVGDGLLSQIPAVLLSLSAGVLVARVDDRRVELGRHWLEPATLLVPAVLLLGISWIPGMPNLAFATVGLALMGAAWFWTAQRSDGEGTPELELVLWVPARGGVEVNARHLRELHEVVALVEANVGLALPRVELRTKPELDRVELRWGDRRLFQGEIAEGLSEAMMAELFRALWRSAGGFLDLERVHAWLEAERVHRPRVVQAALSRFEAREMLRVLRELIRQRVPLPRPRELIAAFAEGPARAEGEALWESVEGLRADLAQAWLGDLLDAHARGEAVTYLRCTPDLELAFEGAAQLVDGAWRPKRGLPQRREIRDEMLAPWAEARALVLVTRARARPAAAAFFEGLAPAVLVLSDRELEAAGVEFGKRAWLDEAAFDALEAA